MKKLLIPLLCLLPNLVFAATLRIDPATRDTNAGDVFIATVRVDVAQGECINAASIALTYPTQSLRLNNLSYGESIFTLWLDEKIDHSKGEVRFTGGIPGGYCGRAAGDPGQSNIIAKVAFQYINKNKENAEIAFLPETEATQNDGQGTKAALVTMPMTVKYSELTSVRNEWTDAVSKDTYPPEAFVPQIFIDPTDNKSPYYLIFGTTDKLSGVEHYEVTEEDPNSFGFRLGSRVKAKPAPVKSPYLLQDQSLSSRIVVRAFDNAGNMQEAIIPPQNVNLLFGVFQVMDYVVPAGIGLIAVAIAFLGYFFKKKYFDRDREDDDSNGDSQEEIS